MKKNIVSLCCGTATGAHALKKNGVKFTYFSIENDKIKREIADHNFEGIERPFHDVTDKSARRKFLKKNKVDLILCGFTCTSLSSQGPRTDFEGDSKIFFDCVEFLEEAREINPEVKFFFENVGSMKNTCRDRISKELGVPFFKGESKLISPQNRVRYYWFNWKSPEIKKIPGIEAKNFLCDDGLEIVGFTKSNRGYDEKGEAIVKGRAMEIGLAATLCTGDGCRGQSTINYVFTKKMKVRKPTVQECANLQGIGHFDFSKWSDAQAYEAIGDGWEFNMVCEILKGAFRD